MTRKKTKPVPKSQRKWVGVTLTGAVFHNVDLSGARIRGALLADVDISGHIQNVTVNGIDIGPLVQAELKKKHPELETLRRTDVEGLREAWAFIESMWKKTTARARKLPADMLNQRVDDEWSFVETLRHLVFATDAWFGRAVLGESRGFWPKGLAHDDAPPWVSQSVGLNRNARPSLDETLAARTERLAAVRKFLADATEEDLSRKCRRHKEGGYPADPSKVDVRTCIRILISEEWQHHQFVTRDLAQLKRNS